MYFITKKKSIYKVKEKFHLSILFIVLSINLFTTSILWKEKFIQSCSFSSAIGLPPEKQYN